MIQTTKLHFFNYREFPLSSPSLTFKRQTSLQPLKSSASRLGFPSPTPRGLRGRMVFAYRGPGPLEAPFSGKTNKKTIEGVVDRCLPTAHCGGFLTEVTSYLWTPPPATVILLRRTRTKDESVVGSSLLSLGG